MSMMKTKASYIFAGLVFFVLTAELFLNTLWLGKQEGYGIWPVLGITVLILVIAGAIGLSFGALMNGKRIPVILEVILAVLLLLGAGWLLVTYGMNHLETLPEEILYIKGGAELRSYLDPTFDLWNRTIYAVTFLFGNRTEAVMVLLIALALLSIVLLYVAMRALEGPIAALISACGYFAGVYFVCDISVYNSFFLWMVIFDVALLLLALSKKSEKLSLVWAVLFAVVEAALIYLNPFGLVLILFCIPDFTKQGKRIAATISFLGGPFLFAAFIALDMILSGAKSFVNVFLTWGSNAEISDQFFQGTGCLKALNDFLTGDFVFLIVLVIALAACITFVMAEKDNVNGWFLVILLGAVLLSFIRFGTSFENKGFYLLLISLFAGSALQTVTQREREEAVTEDLIGTLPIVTIEDMDLPDDEPVAEPVAEPVTVLKEEPKQDFAMFDLKKIPVKNRMLEYDYEVAEDDDYDY